ncbi:MAG: hypothetical protein R3349_08995 [Geminicoccaceae bacterium]|nr:hypothetical protein [Geminicoccaceae bacterium]
MRSQRDGRRRAGIALATLCLIASPAVGQDKEPAGDAGERREVRAESTVECLLPAEIDRLGSQLTKIGPRRTIETTASDCDERQGEVVERPR